MYDGELRYACGVLETPANSQTLAPETRLAKYRVLDKATVRAGPQKKDQKLGNLQRGDIVEVIGDRKDKTGALWLRLEQAQGAQILSERWVKQTTSKGKRLLEQLVDEEMDFVEGTSANERSDCPKRHGLIQTTNEMGVDTKCVLCAELVGASGVIYSCTVCQYNVCSNCFAKSLPVLPKSCTTEVCFPRPPLQYSTWLRMQSSHEVRLVVAGNRSVAA